MAFRLIGVGNTHVIELRGASPRVVGRAMTSDIPVVDPTISRRHAEVSCDADGIHVRDLGSSNGTFVNGVRIDDSRATAGDVLSFGKVAFRVSEPQPTAERPVARPARTPPTEPAGEPIARAAVAAGGESDAAPTARTPSVASAGVAPAAPGVSSPTVVRPLLRMAPVRGEERLTQLLEVSIALGKAPKLDQLLDEIVRRCFATFDVDRAAILLADGDGVLQPRIARDRRGGTPTDVVPRSIARTAVDERAAVLTDNAAADARFGGASVVAHGVRSAICAPLIASADRVLGVLYVDNTFVAGSFGDADVSFLVAFAGIAAVAIENVELADRSRRETLVRGNFERYFSPNLAARIAAEPGAVRLTGERRQVAVMFADVRGFTPIAERLSPDETATLLTEHFTGMAECVFEHGGTLDKFIGDAVMAQWGAPIASDDDAGRAVRAAVDMMRTLDVANAERRGRGAPPLGMGIGLSFGDAFAGNIGSARRMEYTVIGDTVNMASRVADAAAAGEILVTDALRAALVDPPELVAVPPLALKGKADAAVVWRVAR